MRRLLLKTTFLLLIIAASISQADVVLQGTVIGSVRGVAITGTGYDGTFDLYFRDGISYDDLQAKLSLLSPISWTTDADADVVLSAIETEVSAFGLATGDATSTPRTNDVLIPLSEEPGDEIRYRQGTNNSSFTKYSQWFQQAAITRKGSQSTVLTNPAGPSIGAPDAWVTAAPAVEQIVYDASNRPTSVTGLHVRDFGVFDVSLTHPATSSSFDDVFSSGPPATHSVSLTTATAAALQAVMLSDFQSNPTAGTTINFPTSTTATDWSGVAVSASNVANWSNPSSLGNGRGVSLPVGNAFATISVPEPSACILLASIGIGVVGLAIVKSVRQSL